MTTAEVITIIKITCLVCAHVTCPRLHVLSVLFFARLHRDHGREWSSDKNVFLNIFENMYIFILLRAYLVIYIMPLMDSYSFSYVFVLWSGGRYIFKTNDLNTSKCK